MDLGKLLQLGQNEILLNEIKAHRKDVVPFVGAGVSCGCGLYSWRELIGKLESEHLEDDVLRGACEMPLIDRAQRIVDSVGNVQVVMREIGRMFRQADVEPTELPYLLTSHFSNMLVTTNYDHLLENASRQSPRGELIPLLPCLQGQVNDAIQLNERRLLKIHGSLEETSSFVFAKDQYLDFYGIRGNRSGKLIPEYLKRIFTGKKVLFVGCSLERDFTLDVLEECVSENREITHYAIVPVSISLRDEWVRCRNGLLRLGIEPIFYPEGDYEAVHKLMYFLTEDNSFVGFVRAKLRFICASEMQAEALTNALKGSLLKASVRYPELLSIEKLNLDYERLARDEFGSGRGRNDSVFSICESLLGWYVRLGHLDAENAIIASLMNCFEDAVMEETDVEPLLEKKWSLSRCLRNLSDNELDWIVELSPEEIDEYGEELCGKLQYSNGMSFAGIQPFYCEAKTLLGIASGKMSSALRLKLRNNVAAFGHYFRDAEYAIRCLKECIAELDESEDQSRAVLLFKAKCYANLAINESLCDGYDIWTILDHAKCDIDIKRSCAEDGLLLSRSLNFYATALKEVDPFSALESYLESEDIKRNIVVESCGTDLFVERVASWATTVFNVGLLAKDLELYDIAYRLVAYANQRRFRTVDLSNRDYCSSLNVIAELELLVGRECSLREIINGVESRADLPSGFARTQSHTWYVCARYFHNSGRRDLALKYLDRALYASKEEGALYDFRQDVRIRLLRADIVARDDEDGASRLYDEILGSVEAEYGTSSYHLIAPLRHYVMHLNNPAESFCKRLCDLEGRYRDSLRRAKQVLDDFAEQLPPDLGICASN